MRRHARHAWTRVREEAFETVERCARCGTERTWDEHHGLVFWTAPDGEHEVATPIREPRVPWRCGAWRAATA